MSANVATIESCFKVDVHKSWKESKRGNEEERSKILLDPEG